MERSWKLRGSVRETVGQQQGWRGASKQQTNVQTPFFWDNVTQFPKHGWQLVTYYITVTYVNVSAGFIKKRQTKMFLPRNRVWKMKLSVDPHYIFLSNNLINLETSILVGWILCLFYLRVPLWNPLCELWSYVTVGNNWRKLGRKLGVSFSLYTNIMKTHSFPS